MYIYAKDALNVFFRKNWNVDDYHKFEIEFVDAVNFLNAYRIDLICKLLYIEDKELNQNSVFIKQLYIEHIRAFSNGSFIEPGTVEKNSIEKYLKTFDNLINEIKKNGFDEKKSVVPVGDNGAILDGSHRVAIAIYYGLKIPIIRVNSISKNYDYNFFLERKMEKKYVDFMAFKYLLYSKNNYIICLWPKAKGKKLFLKTIDMINELTPIVYQKEIRLNYNGLKQLMLHLYMKHDWIGNVNDGFSGIDYKAECCYDKYGFLNIFVISNVKLNKVVELKEKIRQSYDIGKNSIHITDTDEEAIAAGKILLNDNSINLINYYNLKNNRDLMSKIFENSSNEKIIINENFAIEKIKNNKNNLENPEYYGYIFDYLFHLNRKNRNSSTQKMKFIKSKIKHGFLFDKWLQLHLIEKTYHFAGKILRELGLKK